MDLPLFNNGRVHFGNLGMNGLIQMNIPGLFEFSPFPVKDFKKFDTLERPVSSFFLLSAKYL